MVCSTCVKIDHLKNYCWMKIKDVITLIVNVTQEFEGEKDDLMNNRL